MMGFVDKPFADLLISKAPLSQETRQMIRKFSELPPFKPQKVDHHRSVLEDDYPTIYGTPSLLGNWRNADNKILNETSFFFFLVNIISLFFIIYLLKKLSEKRKDDIHSTLSFTLIGFGFAFAELSFLYKAIWALASPSWGVCWIFVNIFIASSIGAFVSNFINFSQTRKWLLISSPSTTLLFVLGYLFDSQIFPFLYLQSDFLRFASIFVLIWASFGLTGMTFAILLKNVQIKSVASMYALNGTTILIGSLLTIPTHISFGFKIGFLIASILYGLVATMVLTFKQVLPIDIKE